VGSETSPRFTGSFKKREIGNYYAEIPANLFILNKGYSVKAYTVYQGNNLVASMTYVPQ
jgi:hypothetical protein